MIRHQESRVFFRCCRNSLLVREHAVFIINSKALKDFSVRNNRRHVNPGARSSLRYSNLVQKNIERLLFIASDFINFVFLSANTYSKSKRCTHSKANIFPHTHPHFVPQNVVYIF